MPERTTAKVRLLTGGRWSGGGRVVASNLRAAAAERPDVFTTDPHAVVAANLVPRSWTPPSRRGERFVLLPQNAWVWHGPWGSPREAVRRLALRAATQASFRRSLGVIRISSAIPCAPNGACSRVIPNVLDAEFEHALAYARRMSPHPQVGTWVCVAPLWAYKNLDWLISTFDQYRSMGGAACLRIMGAKGTTATLRHLSRAARATDGVRLQPMRLSRAEVLRSMMDAKGVIFPSLVEASPIALLEAAALKVSVLVSNIPGHRETAQQFLPEHSYFDPTVSSTLVERLLTADAQDMLRDERFRGGGAISDRRGRTRERQRWVQELAQAVARFLS